MIWQNQNNSSENNVFGKESPRHQIDYQIHAPNAGNVSVACAQVTGPVDVCEEGRSLASGPQANKGTATTQQSLMSGKRGSNVDAVGNDGGKVRSEDVANTSTKQTGARVWGRDVLSGMMAGENGSEEKEHVMPENLLELCAKKLCL